MEQAVVSKGRFGHIRCLVVEDSEFDQRRIARVLEQLGIRMLSIVPTMREARDYIRRSPVDLILLDNGLPDGSGVDLALELRDVPRFASIPVVLISDWPTPFMFDKALMARVRQVLRKDEFNLNSALRMLAMSGEKNPTPYQRRAASTSR